MKYTTIVNDSAMNGTVLTDPIFFNHSDHLYGSAQVVFVSGTGSVKLQGRCWPDRGTYADLTTPATASETFPVNVPIMPYIRARISSAVNLELEFVVVEH